MDYLSIIEKAFLDYSDWVSRKSKDQTSMLGEKDDLRGIFYNKLVSRLREAGVEIGRFRRNLHPTDFECTFVAPGFIEKVVMVTDFKDYHYTIYDGHPPERREILRNITLALREIDMTKLSNSFTWELTKIINSLKKL